MNSLTLRINRGSGNKSKNSIGFSPVNITTSFHSDSGEPNELLKEIADAVTTDDQLTVLKRIVDQHRDIINSKYIKFLAVVFLEAEPKHPVKCFVSRLVTKTVKLQEPFTEALASQLTVLITNEPTNYKKYVEVVSKVATCIENFNAGVAAIQYVEVNLTNYLINSLELCVKILRDNTSLSPTEKNEVFNLAHLCLRLLLHIVQKGTSDSQAKLGHVYSAIRSCMQALLFDDEAPMDTKSVCGILYLSIHVLENGADSWLDILNNDVSNNSSLVSLLTSETSLFCLYSAIITVVSAERLLTQQVYGQPAILELTEKMYRIGDRNTSNSMIVLGVTRTLVSISKLLNKSSRATGQCIVEWLLLFVWGHLDYHMDSVRHLTAQMLGIIVGYCAKLDKQGHGESLSKLLTAVNHLDTSRKSYYITISCLVNELGSNKVLDSKPFIINDLLKALSSQHIQASASIALDNLVRSDLSARLGVRWVTTVLDHVHEYDLDSTTLNLLENVLVTAVKLDPELKDYIITYVKNISKPADNAPEHLKRILMLLSVLRKCDVKLSASDDDEWKGIIKYDVLKEAAIVAVDETRILSLSLIVSCPRSTEELSAGELSVVLHYLKYNINTQSPNFRQLTLSLMKKLIKRVEDSFKVIKRQKEPNVVENKVGYYLRFVEELREQCFESLVPGANYSRRCVALQVLVWCEQLQLEGYHRTWKSEYVEKLLLHLEDSYEHNKQHALDILTGCPTDLVKNNTYSISLHIKDIFSQASSLKPTDCVSAAYKLDFLIRRLPEYILQGEECSSVSPVRYTLMAQLLQRLRGALGVCSASVVRAAARAPMYGLLHALAHVARALDPGLISSDAQWTVLIDDIIKTCMAVNAGVASVVNNSSPEGHLPMDMSGVLVTDHGNSGGVMLDDGRQVTSQMVLLCAWRSVKEVSLLLGLISSRLSIEGEGSVTGTLRCDQLVSIGEHFTSLLAETKHRGAFEQAYVGFTKLLARLWRCRGARLHALPRRWLGALLGALGEARAAGRCATRRSAGLPFMIQALVTTELEVQSNPSCFHECMSRLLSVVRSSPSAEARAHALNIVRALVRHSALQHCAAPHVGAALVAALGGFERGTWQERNSSTLALSALMVRVFGVARSRDGDQLCARNRMTGRIFFIRYPHLYDFMLAKLQEVSSCENTQVLRPVLYPILLLLARLYPSSLEGATKLLPFAAHVQRCARGGVLRTRQLAAKAMVALVSPELYVTHIQSMFALLTPDIKRNYCHGILLQLVRLLDAKPEALEHLDSLHVSVEDTLWILDQAVGRNPCYLIADEYVKVLNLILWRFVTTIKEDTIDKIIARLDKLIFNSETPHITSGRDVCLSNAIYLYFIVLHRSIEDPCDIVYKGLQHPSYEVVLSTLNYLLILHGHLEDNNCKFEKHLIHITNRYQKKYLNNSDKYIKLLCKVLKNDHLECKKKSLKILTLLGDTQKYIIEAKMQQEITEDMVIDELLVCLRDEHENLTNVYLESLLHFVTKKWKCNSLSDRDLLEVMRVGFEYSSSDNSEDTRSVVVQFIENNTDRLLGTLGTSGTLSKQEIFELSVTRWCTLVSLLEDDERALRQRTCDALTSQWRIMPRVPAAASPLLTRLIAGGGGGEGTAALVVLALLDFNSLVLTDDGDDSQECRVFDHNEKYNIFLEETVWTSNCADIIVQCANDVTPIDFVLSIVNDPVYKNTIDKLCKQNIIEFKKIIAGHKIRNDAVNPKIELFFNILSKQ